MANNTVSSVRVRVHGVVVNLPTDEYTKMLAIGLNPEIVIDDNLPQEATTSKATTSKATTSKATTSKANTVKDERSTFLKALDTDKLLKALIVSAKGSKVEKALKEVAKGEILSVMQTQYNQDEPYASDIASALELGDPVLLVVSNAPLKLSGILAMLGFTTKKGRKPYDWINGTWQADQPFDAVYASYHDRQVTVIRMRLADGDNKIKANMIMMI